MIRLARLSIRRPRAVLEGSPAQLDRQGPKHEVLLLARTREHFVESGDARAALAYGLLPAAVQLMGRWSWWPTAPPGVRHTAPQPIPPIAPRGTSS